VSNQYIFLSAMPRTGSNLLSSILNQNELLHSEGFSAMCNILWNFDLSISQKNIQQELNAVDKNNEKKIKELSLGLFDSYYGLQDKIIFDKSTSWTLTENINLLKKCVTKKPKIIVLTRDIEDVVKSYVNIYLKNGFSQIHAEQEILNFDDFGRNPIMRPIAGIMNSKINKEIADFLYIDYEDLVFNTEKIIKNIYTFCNIDFYNHSYDHIELKYKENENFILKHLVDVRPTISKREINIQLSEKAIEKIQNIKKLLNEIELDCKNINTINKFKKFYEMNTY
jgi:hypothetical protein